MTTPHEQPDQLMTRDDVVDLLSLIASLDRRQPDPDAVTAWWLVAQAGRWTRNAAAKAVVDHFATSTEYLMPAHITTRVRMQRPSVPENRLAIASSPPASEEVRALAMDAARAVSARLPQVAELVGLPKTRRRRATADDVRRRAEAEAELARVRGRRGEGR